MPGRQLILLASVMPRLTKYRGSVKQGLRGIGRTRFGIRALRQRATRDLAEQRDHDRQDPGALRNATEPGGKVVHVSALIPSCAKAAKSWRPARHCARRPINARTV
jgi:hypothetical protein